MRNHPLIQQRQFTLYETAVDTSVGWGVTDIFTGTVSADGNTITGEVIYQPSTGNNSAKATFTWTRKVISFSLPEPGDVVMYYSVTSEVDTGAIRSTGSLNTIPKTSYPHVAIIIEGGVKQKPDGTTTITKVRSKWDGGAVYDHDPNDNPYGKNWTVWHRNKKPPNCVPEECNWLEHNPNETDTFFSVCSENKIDCILTDKGRRIYASGAVTASITDEYPPRYPSAKRVDPPIGVEISKSVKKLLLIYDCRGFVFGLKKYAIAEYNVPLTFNNQVQEILDDGYTQIHAKDTEGKQH